LVKPLIRLLNPIITLGRLHAHQLEPNCGGIEDVAGFGGKFELHVTDI